MRERESTHLALVQRPNVPEEQPPATVAAFASDDLNVRAARVVEVRAGREDADAHYRGARGVHDWERVVANAQQHAHRDGLGHRRCTRRHPGRSLCCGAVKRWHAAMPQNMDTQQRRRTRHVHTVDSPPARRHCATKRADDATVRIASRSTWPSCDTCGHVPTTAARHVRRRHRHITYPTPLRTRSHTSENDHLWKTPRAPGSSGSSKPRLAGSHTRRLQSTGIVNDCTAAQHCHCSAQGAQSATQQRSHRHSTATARRMLSMSITVVPSPPDATNSATSASPAIALPCTARQEKHAAQWREGERGDSACSRGGQLTPTPSVLQRRAAPCVQGCPGVTARRVAPRAATLLAAHADAAATSASGRGHGVEAPVTPPHTRRSPRHVWGTDTHPHDGAVRYVCGTWRHDGTTARSMERWHNDTLVDRGVCKSMRADTRPRQSSDTHMRRPQRQR